DLTPSIQATVSDFALATGEFRHVLIVQVRDKGPAGRVYGAIRCVNHLDSVNNHDRSNSPFERDDQRLIAGIAQLLGSWYADHRQRVKGEKLDTLEDKIDLAKTEDEAIDACIKDLTSEEIGFPMAI